MYGCRCQDKYLFAKHNTTLGKVHAALERRRRSIAIQGELGRRKFEPAKFLIHNPFGSFWKTVRTPSRRWQKSLTVDDDDMRG